jgi:hypothetical protein
LIAPLLSALIGFVALALIHVAVGAWQAHRRRWDRDLKPWTGTTVGMTDWRDEEADCAPEMPTLPDPVALLFAECGYSREVE